MNIMKKKILHLACLAVLTLSAACDKDFEKVNINPVAPTKLNSAYLFANAQNASAGTNIVYQGVLVQHHMIPFLGVAAGGNVNQLNVPETFSTWNQYYGAIKHLVDVIDKTKNDPTRANLYNMARIWKAYTFQILTDTYGDIPYFEAGKGYSADITYPKYDKQQDIYSDLLNELEQASAALDATKPIETNDLFYKGDVAKWKKLGNSLLLRVAMRLVKIDPDKAKTYAAKAFAGGTMQSNTDNAAVQHTPAYTNPIGTFIFNSTEKANYYLNQTFVDTLKKNNNPLLGSIAVIYADATKPANETTADANPTIQIGMPTGYDDKTITTAPGYPGSLYKYSQANRVTWGGITAPSFFVTYAQTQLLLAEAAFRGWISADAAALYRSGVEANMQQAAVYGGNSAIAQPAIDAYLAAHPYNPARALVQINTEYWIASFLNPIEAWGNYRRTDLPGLAPNNYASPSIPPGSTIRRIVYPNNEASLNEDNYKEAVGRQGADVLENRVWWDKKP